MKRILGTISESIGLGLLSFIGWFWADPEFDKGAQEVIDRMLKEANL